MNKNDGLREMVATKDKFPLLSVVERLIKSSPNAVFIFDGVSCIDELTLLFNRATLL